MFWAKPKTAPAAEPLPPEPTHFCCDACRQLLPRDELTVEKVQDGGSEWWPWLCLDHKACDDRARLHHVGYYERSLP